MKSACVLCVIFSLVTVFLWRAAVSRCSQFFSRIRYKGNPKRRSIALTFDDGPSLATLELSALLVREGIRATFFVCGANVERHPGVIAQLIAAGHEIGNHTYTHRRLCPRLGWKLNLLSAAEVYDEFARTQKCIISQTGVTPRFMRAPYGFRWFGMRAVERGLALKDISWTVIAHDWEWTARDVVQQVLKNVSPGGIVCLHDGRDTRTDPDISVTLAAVAELIPLLRAKRYSFEPVGQLLQP